MSQGNLHRGLHGQQGLSLIGVAIFMALLAACAMGALYWMRYERNPITDIMNGQVGKAHKATGTAGAHALPAIALPAAPQGPIRKCVIAGKTVYSDTECPKSAGNMKLHDSQGFAPPPKPVQESEAGASATLQQKATERAIEKATR